MASSKIEHVNAAVLDAVKQTGLVIVSGHSMGGAVATMAAAEFVSNLQLDNVWLYTFGSPRTGDYSFTQVRCCSLFAAIVSAHARRLHICA